MNIDLKDIGHVASQTKDPESGELTIKVCFDSLPEAIDRVLKEKGNLLQCCSWRLYWVGATTIREAGQTLKLSSRLLYERWVCIPRIQVKLLQDTKTVEWELVLIDYGRELRIVARVTNVRNLAPHLEMLSEMRVAKEIQIPVPMPSEGACSDFELEEIEFSRDANGRVGLKATVQRPLSEVSAA